MGGDDFNKTDDDEGNYQLDVNQIARNLIANHNNKVQTANNVNRDWVIAASNNFFNKNKKGIENAITSQLRRRLPAGKKYHSTLMRFKMKKRNSRKTQYISL